MNRNKTRDFQTYECMYSVYQGGFKHTCTEHHIEVRKLTIPFERILIELQNTVHESIKI